MAPMLVGEGRKKVMLGALGIEDSIPDLRRYASFLLRGANVEDEADDLVQSCLLRAMDGIETRDVDGNVRSWLFAILRNVFISPWRRQRVRNAVLVDLPSADTSVSPCQGDRLALAEVMERVEGLPAPQRDVLLLVVVEQMSYADAAATLGIPLGTVMSRLSRARDRLARSEVRDHPSSLPHVSAVGSCEGRGGTGVQTRRVLESIGARV